MTQRWFTELLLLHIPIILIPTQGIIPEWGWRGERRDLHWAVGAELGHARVVVEPEHAQVVAEPELARGVAQLELGQVGAVAVPGHQRARLAVAPKTKSVTAAHRRGLPLRVAEDLAVVAETTREPAATGEVIAWAAAVTAVVAAVAVAVAAVAEAEDADDEQTID